MANEIISYMEMCRREGLSLQRGMNFRVSREHSVILMSLRPNAPYADSVENEGTTIIYEGHDEPRSEACPDPKIIDQPETRASGTPTENGKFHEAARLFKQGKAPPERVRVYEKIKQGIWAYNGTFQLEDSWRETSSGRQVFKFKLVALEEEADSPEEAAPQDPSHRRIIPTRVKLEVWKRDGGRCVKCGATEDLHFDHVIPFSKGGSSTNPENIQLLCGKHNIQKRDRIE